MSADMITLALSKGRIFEETVPLLKAAGFLVECGHEVAGLQLRGVHKTNHGEEHGLARGCLDDDALGLLGVEVERGRVVRGAQREGRHLVVQRFERKRVGGPRRAAGQGSEAGREHRDESERHATSAGRRTGAA